MLPSHVLRMIINTSSLVKNCSFYPPISKLEFDEFVIMTSEVGIIKFTTTREGSITRNTDRQGKPNTMTIKPNIIITLALRTCSQIFEIIQYESL